MHHFRHKKSPGVENLWIIVPISNPARYKSRYNLFNKFKKHVERHGANLFVVELALGDRPFEITEENNPNHLQLRSWDEIWHKENMINLAISRLPANWEYVAWIDGDIEFVRDDWVEEIPHQLQHNYVVQLFQNAVDLGPQGEVLKVYDSFGWAYSTKQPRPYSQVDYYQGGRKPHYHPGYAWAARREAIDYLGGLLDVGILGSSDHHMAWALIGKVNESYPKNVSESYVKHLLVWQERAIKHIKNDVSYMKGTILHHFHGKKRDRKYGERWEILTKHKFDPFLDIKRDSQGLYTFTDIGERMRSDIRDYFHARNEDSIDVD